MTKENDDNVYHCNSFYKLEQETENPFVFKRFYNEVTYYGETMRQIREYEEVFEDKLEDDVKIQLLGC